MPKAPAPWERPYHEPQGGVASVRLNAFAERAIDLGAAVSRSRHGIPAEFEFEQLEITQHLREESPEWFDGFFTTELPSIADRDLGDEREALSHLRAMYSVRLELEEPADLGYLQGCWGAIRWICEQGGQAVLDAAAIRWHGSKRLMALDPMRDFQITHEISVVFESDCDADFGHVCHTRGLAKFGRPDIVLLGAQPDDMQACGLLLNGLATRAAFGAAFRAQQTVGPRPLSPRRLLPYEPDAADPQVNLNNDGLVLDIAGWGLRDAVRAR